MKFANFVQCTLVAAITAASTTIQVEAADPYNLPPDPAGETAFLTLTDSLINPTAFEIIGYTGVTSIDASSLELTGVLRGQDGTIARSWAAGDYARQDLVAANLSLATVNKSFFYAGSIDGTVRKFAPSGKLVWTNGDANAVVRTVDVDAYGVYTGDDNGGLRRISHDNTLVWESNTVHSGPVVKVIGDGRGNVFSLAQSDGFSGSLKKHDADGNEVWEYAPASWSAVSFAVGANGFIYVVTPYQLLQIEPKTGFLVRTATKSGGGGSISATPDGFIWAWIDLRLRKYDFGLNEVLVLDGADGRVNGLSGAVAPLKDGSAIIMGEIDHSAVNYTLARINAAGEPVWLAEMPDSLIPLNALMIDGINALPSGDVAAAHGATYIAYLLSGEDGSIIASSGLADFQGSITSTAVWPRTNSVTPIFDGAEFGLGQPLQSDLAGVPTTKTELILREAVAPGTPASGHAIIFLDKADGALKVKFDTGTVTTLASP